MADNQKFVQNQPTTLAGAGSSIGDTSVILTSFAQINGTLLTMTDFGDKGFCTIEPGNGIQEEQISFTGITQNSNGTATLTGVKSVLTVSPYTETSGLSTTHAGGTQLVVSNTAGFYNRLTAKDDDETITGTWTFTNPNYPRMDSATPAPTDNVQLVTKKYVDDTAFNGAPDASTTVKGIVQEATQAQVDAGTTAGSTSARLFINPSTQRARQYSDYAADSVGTDSYAISPVPAITSYGSGQVFVFKAGTANTGGATLAVSGLSAIAINKNYNSALVTGDIVANQIVEVIYDGTVMQMVSPVARDFVDTTTAQSVGGVKTFSSSPIAPTPSGSTDVAIKSYVDGNPITSTNGTATRSATAASSAQTIAHGLGRTPKKVRITARLVAGNTNTVSLFLSDGTYNGTTNSSVWAFTTNSGTETAGVSTTQGVHLDNGSASQVAVITVDGTNITLTWTYTATMPSATIQMMWEAI